MQLIDKWILRSYQAWTLTRKYMEEESAYRVGYRDGVDKFKHEVLRILSAPSRLTKEEIMEKIRTHGDEHIF